MNATDAVNALNFLERQAELDIGTPDSKAMCLRVAAHLLEQVKRLTADKIDDGGQAFPQPGTSYGPAGDFSPSGDGMTLRDYFAARAMQSILSVLHEGIRPADLGHLGADCYAVADAMLKARQS